MSVIKNAVLDYISFNINTIGRITDIPYIPPQGGLVELAGSKVGLSSDPLLFESA